MLDQARQYAIAQNTYVWVVMRPNPSGSNGDELNVAVLASRTGTDTQSWSSYGVVPNGQIDLLSRPKTFSQVRFNEAGSFGASKIPALTGKSTATSGNSPSTTADFKIKLPGAASTVDFTRAIQFTPTGEARTAQGGVTDLVELDIQPTHGTTADQNNVAVVRINGLTGQMTMYRP